MTANKHVNLVSQILVYSASATSVLTVAQSLLLNNPFTKAPVDNPLNDTRSFPIDVWVPQFLEHWRSPR